MPAPRARQLLLQRARTVLALDEVAGDAAQPFAMLRSVVHAEEPGEAEQHSGAFYGVLPAPAGRVLLHGHADGVARALQKRALPGLLVRPQVARPEVAIEVRGVVHVLCIGEGLPASGFERPDVHSVLAEPEPACGAQVCQQSAKHPFVPVAAAEPGRGENGREQHAGVVVAVVPDGPGRMHGAPSDEAERRMRRVGADAPAHAAADEEIVEQVARRFRACAVFVDHGIEREHHRRFGVAVRPQRKPLRLRAVGEYGGGIPFEYAEGAVAGGFVRWRDVNRLGARGKLALDLGLSPRGHEQPRVVVPLNKRAHGLILGIVREPVEAAVSGPDPARRLEVRHGVLRIEFGENDAPRCHPFVVWGKTRRNEPAEHGCGDHQAAVPGLSEKRRRVLWQPEQGGVVAGDTGD